MSLVFIASATANEPGTGSGECELTFIDGADGVVFDNTYNEYQFYFVNMHPETGDVAFQFQVNSTNDPASGGGAYDTSLITNTYFVSYHNEAGTDQNLAYSGSNDQAQTADYCKLTHGLDNEDKDGCSGILTIYDPSSTTFVKHFMARTNATHHTSEYSMDSFCAGYINDYQYAIDEISFKMSSGDIDAGTIYMYGVG